VEAARSNAERAGVLSNIAIDQRPVSAAEFPDTPGWIVSNPPYGLRIGESAPLRNLYSALGKILKTRAQGYLVALLSADRKLEAQLGIELDEKFRTTNGGIPVRLVTGRHE
jgi:putative N6-adenine-specific DNA methylase